MKKLILPLLLILVGFQMVAQTAQKTYVMMIESRVKDVDLYKKNNPIVRNWWMKEAAGVITNRIAHTSESGRTYNMISIRGEKNLGEYIAKREAWSDKIAVELKDITEASRTNAAAALQRSTWVAVDKMSVRVPDFKAENYDFRKVILFTVPFDKTAEYENALEESNSIDKSLGFSFNQIVYRATDGYPVNTYMMILPDKSRIDYYTHQQQRNDVRKKNTRLGELSKITQGLRSITRIDYLSRVPFN